MSTYLSAALTLCFYDVAYTFRVTLHSVCLNFKEVLAWNKRDIWILGDCNGTRTHHHLVRKRTPNHLAKLAKWSSCDVDVYLFDALNANAPYRLVFTTQLNHLASLAEWLSGLSGCGFESRCSHLIFRYRAGFEEGVPYHSGNLRV